MKEAISGSLVLIRAHQAGEYVRLVRTTTRHAIAHDVGEALREAAAAAAAASVAPSSTATSAAASAAASASAAAAAAAAATLVVGGCELEKAHLIKVIRSCG
jgi:hypothetical protein